MLSIKANNSQQISNIAENSYRTEGTGLNTPLLKQSEYSYDLNGNLMFSATGKLKDEKLQATSTRKMLWDEENRLQAVSDNGFVSNYWYDASGERTVKESFDNEGVYVNGFLSAGRTSTGKFTAYVSPYLVVNNGGYYSKHIYIGSQRIMSKLGSSEIFHDTVNPVSPTNPHNLAMAAKLSTQNGKIQSWCDSLGVVYRGTSQGSAGFITSITGRITSPQLYFYHPDHLGSSSLITDNNGTLVQHLEYLPFGEVFVEENKSTWSTPYKFTSKELDAETGLYYFGARYYDPKTSVWLSVDPLAEKYINTSSYVYCHNNPSNRIDPDGKGDENTSGKPSVTNLSDGVPTSAQSSVRTTDPQEKIKPIPYTPPPPPLGEIRDANKENLIKIHNEAMNDPIKKQCLTDPALKAMAGGVLATGTAVLVPEIASVVTQLAKEKGLPILYKSAEIVMKNPEISQAAIGAGIGIFTTIATGESQDVPQFTTGIPQIDNWNTRAQFFMTVGAFTQYVSSGGSQTQATDGSNASNKKLNK